MTHTAHLCQSNLFQKRSEVISRDARAILSYDRARAIGLAFGTSAAAPSFTEHLKPSFLLQAYLFMTFCI